MDVQKAVAVLREVAREQSIGESRVCNILKATARAVLADAYLALHREDDGKEVRKGTVRIGEYDLCVDAHEPSQDLWTIEIWKDDDHIGGVAYKTRPTLGMLRHLVLAMGGSL